MDSGVRMRRGLAIRGVALGASAAFVVASAGPGAAAKPDKPKPRPKLALLTETQQEALRKHAVKVEVRSKRGDEVRAKATLVVEGFPEDYSFRLGPESKQLRDQRAKVRLELSARQREVLAFAAQACDEATLDIEARAANRTGTLEEKLPSDGC